MVLLTIAIVVFALAIWKISPRTDPHHTFFVSLLPLLDLEHRSAGTLCNFDLKNTSGPKAA